MTTPKPAPRMVDVLAAFPGRFIADSGVMCIPHQDTRLAVRWADAAIARAQHRTKFTRASPGAGHAVVARVQRYMQDVTALNPGAYNSLPGLPAWPGQLAKYRPE